MPSCKKPRRPYNPRKLDRAKRRPILADVVGAFGAIRAFFDQLKTGELDAERGHPVYWDDEYGWCHVGPALDGWCACWGRFVEGLGLPIDLAPMRKLGAKLANGTPVTLEEIAAAEKVVNACQSAYLKTPANVSWNYVTTERIAIAMQDLNQGKGPK